jgi:hypothetical protein
VLSQLIEQKFKALSYKELSKMLKLVPLEETTSGQELLHDHTIKMLTQHIEAKFNFSEKTMDRITIRLRKLALKDLEALFKDILDMKTLKQLNAWLDEHLPETAAPSLESR